MTRSSGPWLAHLRQLALRHGIALLLLASMAVFSPTFAAAASPPVDPDCENCHTVPAADPCLMTASGDADAEPATAMAAPPAPRPAPAVTPVLIVLPPVPTLAAELLANGVAATASPTARTSGQPPLHLLLGRLRN